jgi:hypothetical protein
MSYYTCAPLARTPVLFLLWALYFPAEGSGSVAVDNTARGVLMSPPIVLWWAYLVLLAERTIHRDAAGLGAVAVAIPLLWLVAGGVVLLGVSAVARFLGLVVYSLQP